MERSSDSRPHVMVFPYPVQGHLTPTMHFSRKLAAQGILVTFVTTHYRLAHILNAGEESSLKLIENEGVRLVGLHDGLPDDNPRNPISMDFVHSVDNLGGQLEVLLGALSPPLSCLVSDSFLPWTQPIADKWGFPRALFWTQSLSVCSSYVCTSKLISAGCPLFKRVKCRGEKQWCIPGLPEMDPYDLPFNGDTDFPDEESENMKWLRHIIEFQFSNINEAAWFIANSFEELEGPLCTSSIIPPSKLLLLGPLTNDLDPHLPSPSCFRASLWKEDADDCLQWLDTQTDDSVLYISFGSVVVRSPEAMQDVATALLACRQPFLWALRLGWEDARASLSKEFWEFAMEAGKLTTWTSQLKVLSHRAVGGFFSHGGWNSTVESISKGVPMLVWPCFLDQFTNSWAVSCYWKIGVQVMREEGSDVVQELERAIRTLMQGPESLAFRARVSELAAAAMAPSSSNRQHFTLFVEDMFKRAKRVTQENST